MADKNATRLDFRNKRGIPFNFPDGLLVKGKELVIDSTGSGTLEKPLSEQAASLISEDPENKIKQGEDGKLFVTTDLSLDPLAYYILAKN